MAKDTYTVGGKTVIVESLLSRRIFATAYGIKVYVEPKRKWYCVWLCKKGSSKADLIEASCDLVIQGDNVIPLQGSCENCASKSIKKWYYHTPSLGFPGIAATRYRVNIRIGNERRILSDEFLF